MGKAKPAQRTVFDLASGLVNNKRKAILVLTCSFIQ